MRSNTARYILFIILSLVLLLVAAALSLSVGEISIPIADLPKVLSNPSSTEYGVLANIRIPRTLLGLAIGGSLSLSGVILQGIYRNPLVEPYTLGISGGASLGITVAIVTGLSAISRIVLVVFGFAGAFATIFFVYMLSTRRGTINVNRMLLVGVMISFISSSLVMFLMSITAVENIPGIIFWTMGSLNESNIYVVNGIVLLSLAMLAVSHLFATPLNALRIGESKARHLGINTGVTIRLLFILTSLLTGSCIAVAGIIGFVGLIIPHITRLMVGMDYRILLVTSFLNGGIFLILCDILSRIVISPNELPLGVITGILGGIVFIFIISHPKMKNKLN